jgi:hypothetical protein
VSATRSCACERIRTTPVAPSMCGDTHADRERSPRVPGSGIRWMLRVCEWAHPVVPEPGFERNEYHGEGSVLYRMAPPTAITHIRGFLHGVADTHARLQAMSRHVVSQARTNDTISVLPNSEVTPVDHPAVRLHRAHLLWAHSSPHESRPAAYHDSDQWRRAGAPDSATTGAATRYARRTDRPSNMGISGRCR